MAGDDAAVASVLSKLESLFFLLDGKDFLRSALDRPQQRFVMKRRFFESPAGYLLKESGLVQTELSV